jgi:hypothetical protein
MVCIDRRVSPNQLALWTIYELRDMTRQAIGGLRIGRLAHRGRTRAVGRWLVAATARVLRCWCDGLTRSSQAWIRPVTVPWTVANRG